MDATTRTTPQSAAPTSTHTKSTIYTEREHMSTETVSPPFSLTEGYEALDGPTTGSASEALTIAYAQLQITLTESKADADLREYGAYVDDLIGTIELLDLPADAPMSTVVGLLLITPAGDGHPSPPYDLLACLIVTMSALAVTHANTLAEYVETVSNQVSTNMFADEVEERTLRPGLLDATIDIDIDTPTINLPPSSRPRHRPLQGRFFFAQ
jgi:hypothetical protein